MLIQIDKKEFINQTIERTLFQFTGLLYKKMNV